MAGSLTEIILSANKADHSGYITVPILRINQSGNPKNLGPKKNKPYFFIPRLPSKRHCRIYKDGFIDYTVEGTRWYESLQDWAADCGSDHEQIAFGFETENELYGYVMVVSYFQCHNNFLQLERVLSKMNLGIENVAVVNQNRVTMALDLM